MIHENRSASTDLIGHKERIEAIRYDEFFSQFMLSNKMCVFSNEMTRSWRSRKEWVRNGKPNFEFLSDRFGRNRASLFSVLLLLVKLFVLSYIFSKPPPTMLGASALILEKSPDRPIVINYLYFCCRVKIFHRSSQIVFSNNEAPESDKIGI